MPEVLSSCLTHAVCEDFVNPHSMEYRKLRVFIYSVYGKIRLREALIVNGVWQLSNLAAVRILVLMGSTCPS